jgi:phage/plasmid-like protein (TIGR03299 family)
MSAELESMFYYGETPWHNQGTKVDHVLTAQEAIKEAKLDWDVETVPVFTSVNNIFEAIKDKSAIRRKTDNSILGIMSDNFTPIQNQEAFNFFDSVVASNDAHYHTAGSLQGGKKIWMLAKLNGGNGTISINGDAVDKYLLLMNGHDGSLALRMFFTPVRVVCMNTLMASLSKVSSDKLFYSRHTVNLANRVEQAREIVGISLKFYDKFIEQATSLALKQLPAPQLPKLLAAAFCTSGALKIEDVVQFDQFSTRREHQFEKVQALFEGQGKGLDTPAIKGTKWAAYNAIVEYVDYGKEYHGEKADDRRLYNTWFGSGAQVKAKAWNYLLKN